MLYPMNALANDQARRIAKIVHEHADELGPVTVGLYTGDSAGGIEMTETSVIGDRYAMRKNPPDILLTNYKMLGMLLLRSEDTLLFAGAGESLRYRVLVEFHTYDGAQGTDVAMLLRRLGMALGITTDERPLGAITPVATLGGGGEGGMDPRGQRHAHLRRRASADRWRADGAEPIRHRDSWPVQEPYLATRGFLDVAAEMRFVVDTVQRRMKEGAAPSIAILARRAPEQDRMRLAMQERGIPVELCQQEGSGNAAAVKIASMHRAKGTEYSRVIVIAAEAGAVPPDWMIESRPDADHQAARGRQRSLFYVACSRARDELIVTWSGKPSPFLPLTAA